MPEIVRGSSICKFCTPSRTIRLEWPGTIVSGTRSVTFCDTGLRKCIRNNHQNIFCKLLRRNLAVCPDASVKTEVGVDGFPGFIFSLGADHVVVFLVALHFEKTVAAAGTVR